MRRIALVSLLCLAVAGTARGEGGSPLHDAALAGDVAAIEALLAGGADINAKNGYGATPLHDAASRGHLVAIEALFAGGADVDATAEAGPVAQPGESGPTPLHLAAHNGHPGAIEALLAGGADINARAVSGDRYTKGSLAKTLLRAVGIVFIEDNEVWTPLHAAYRGREAAESETARFHEAIELLKAHGGRLTH